MQDKMNDQIRLTFIQTSLYWEDIPANLEHFSSILNTINEPTDIIVLPEMFTTGFSMNSSKLAEGEAGSGVTWMKKMSEKFNSAITGSMIFSENGKYYNRMIWAEPGKPVLHYDKRHLFTMANEQDNYSRGTSKTIIDYKGWKILPLICYDLRFPVWSRNAEEYDLLIYAANWPERRNHAWKTLLPARAIENQCYVVGVNRIGKDGKGIPYSGDSAAYDFMGNIISSAAAHKEECITITLDKKPLASIRSEFPVLKDADHFVIHNQ